MANIQRWCERCGETRNHLIVAESRIHICSGCGGEKKFRPEDRVRVRRLGKLQSLVIPDQLALMRKHRAADESVSALAKEFGVSGRVIRYFTRGVIITGRFAAPAHSLERRGKSIIPSLPAYDNGKDGVK